jgi:hypothetical protein
LDDFTHVIVHEGRYEGRTVMGRDASCLAFVPSLVRSA